MITLSFSNIIGDRRRQRMQATITTQHPSVRYNVPVILLEDGEPLDYQSWFLLAYRVEDVDTREELDLLDKWIRHTDEQAGMDPALSALNQLHDNLTAQGIDLDAYTEDDEDTQKGDSPCAK